MKFWNFRRSSGTYECEQQREQQRQSIKDVAALLDEHKPGWYENVTRPLDMMDIHRCLLGQVFREEANLVGTSGYNIGLQVVHALGNRAYAAGIFSSPTVASLWREEIARRYRQKQQPLEQPIEKELIHA